MTEPTITPSTAPGSGSVTVRDRQRRGTIDLRFHEAQWTYRQLQARVSHARDCLAQAEADAAVRAPIVAEEPVEEDVNASLVGAPDTIAHEWGETARTAEDRLVAADAEVRRIFETARAEAHALETEAEFLRSHPVVGLGDPSASGAVGVSGAAGAAGATVVDERGAAPC